MKVKTSTLASVMAALAIASFAVARPDKADIVDTAVSSNKFPTLVAALKAAGLVEALKGKGPFTVFAPTEAAFKKLPKGTVEMLLKPENKQKLVSILTYHVVPGQVLAKDVAGLKSGTAVKTLQGQSITVKKSHGIYLNKSKIVATDVVATNGVIHVIDTVLMPK